MLLTYGYSVVYIVVYSTVGSVAIYGPYVYRVRQCLGGETTTALSSPSVSVFLRPGGRRIGRRHKDGRMTTATGMATLDDFAEIKCQITASRTLAGYTEYGLDCSR
jgi:hypothetical protein